MCYIPDTMTPDPRRSKDPPTAYRDAVREAVRAEVEADAHVLAGYLFGSVARAESTPLSDVDVALLFAEEMPTEDRERRAARFGAAVSRRIPGGPHEADVHDIEELPLAVRGRVLVEGVRTGGTDSPRRVAFEDVTLRRYFDFLPHHRADVEEGLRALRKRFSGG
jgi:predicted nucleotidyltransferase